MKLRDMILLTVIAAAIFSLCGCDRNGEPLAIIASPPAVFRNWTPEEECALADALMPYPSNSILWTLHDDWARMRREMGVKLKKSNYKCKEAIEPEAHLLS